MKKNRARESGRDLICILLLNRKPAPSYSVICLQQKTVTTAFHFQYKSTLTNWADRVLIDAPCSGLGTLKRNPDLKWKLTEERISEVIELQQKILLEQSKWVKEGGKLIYVTCSILPSENQNQIAWFLKQPEGAGYILEKEEMLYSHQTGFDGFYAARLIRNSCE